MFTMQISICLCGISTYTKKQARVEVIDTGNMFVAGYTVSVTEKHYINKVVSFVHLYMRMY